MKVCYLTNIPSPYRVDFFNELGKYCDLTVIFEKKRSNERHKEWTGGEFTNFHGVFLDGLTTSTDTAFSLKGLKYIQKNQYDIVVSTNFLTPTGMLQIAKLKRLKIPYFLEADGGFAGSGKGFKEWLKKKVITGAQLYFSTSKACDKYFLTYGAEETQLRRYPFTSIQGDEVLANICTQEEKKAIRSALNINEQNVIISVGRFSYNNGYGKGFDTLVEVSKRLPKSYGIYIIGDEPTEEFKALKEDNKLDNLHYVPFKPKQELAKYYQAADLSALLSRGEAWGLVINEAMANGLPVIATSACIAGLEMIDHGENGYLVSVDDADAVCHCIERYFADKQKQPLMQEACLRKATAYTIQSMVDAHRSVFEEFVNR